MANPTKEQWLESNFELADDFLYYEREVETDVYMFLQDHEDASTYTELVERHGKEVTDTGIEVVKARMEADENFYNYLD